MRPQKKEQKRVQAMISALEVGDTVLTTSGFYGVIIDITDEDVIVEFGSNKNCRIPMQKVRSRRLRKHRQSRKKVKAGIWLLFRRDFCTEGPSFCIFFGQNAIRQHYGSCGKL